MKAKSTVLVLVINILRYLASFGCIGIGIFICLGNTNSMVGASMAFACAVMISPLLDFVVGKMGLHYDTSYKALLVIALVIVDIVSSKTEYWLWVDLGIALMLFVLFAFLSNVKKDKQNANEKTFEQKDSIKIETTQSVMPVVQEKSLAEKLTIFEEEPIREKKIELLDSPQSVYEYIMNHGYGLGCEEDTIIDNVSLILQALGEEERILFSFMGYHQYETEFDHQGVFAYALTNRRLIFARKGHNGQVIQAVALPKIERVTLKKGIVDGVMTLYTMKSCIKIAMDNDTCRRIASRILKFVDEIQRIKATLVK